MFKSIALQHTLLSNIPRKIDIFQNLVQQYRSCAWPLSKKHSFANSKFQKIVDFLSKSLDILPPPLPCTSSLPPLSSTPPCQASQAKASRASKANRQCNRPAKPAGQQYAFSCALKEGRARKPLIRVSRLRRPFTFVGPLRSSCMSSSPLCGGFRDLVQTDADVLKSIL